MSSQNPLFIFKLCVGVAILLFAGIDCGAQPSKAVTATLAPEASIGIYLTALFDISPDTDSYIAELYVWSNSTDPKVDPLDTIVFTNAKRAEVMLKWSEWKGDTLWSVRKYRCEFLHDWDLSNFPFDRHQVAIVLRDSRNHNALLNYKVDATQSGMDRIMQSSGWSFSDFKTGAVDVPYTTNFGEPNATGKPVYRWIVTEFEMRREGWGLFAKLLTGAYLSLGVALMMCFMKTNQPPVFAGRTVSQISCLFAALINHRATDTEIGHQGLFALPDIIHIMIYVAIGCAVLITLRSRVLNERGEEQKAIRFERSMTLVTAGIFIAVNGILVIRALNAPIADALLPQLFFQN